VSFSTRENFKLISLFLVSHLFLYVSLCPPLSVFDVSHINKIWGITNISLPCLSKDSINLRWFAFFKLGKCNALCNTGNALYINPVVGSIFENVTFHGFLVVGVCFRLAITFCFCKDLCWNLIIKPNISRQPFKICNFENCGFVKLLWFFPKPWAFE